MRKLPLEEIKDFSSGKVIEDLRSRKYSLLQCAGCDKLRKEMRGPGLACRLVINWAWHTCGGGDTRKHDRRVAKKLAKFLEWGAPADFHGKLPDSTSVVVGFNHPSLGEIIRFMRICLTEYHHRVNLFPVNLPWYEALMPVVDKLERLGVYITPIITPSTYEKMRKYVKKEDMPIIEDFRKGFSMHYFNLCAEFAKEGAVIWVAPSATRRATVFASEKAFEDLEPTTPPVMTSIASSIVHKKVTDCVFVATGVVPSGKCGRGLNLFKDYTISFGEIYDYSLVSSQVRTKNPVHGGRVFEHVFLKSICNTLSAIDADYLLHP